MANKAGAYQVTAHLADYHGYDSIGFIAGPPDSPDSASRLDGFRRAMTERGMPEPRRPDAHGDFTTDGGRRAAAEILATGPAPRALVCANDQTAIGAMRELQHAGLRIPEDVALTGFDGISLGEHLRPGITTVVQPMRELGQTAVNLIKERSASPELPSRAVELPVRMELRGSCGCAEPDTQPDYRPGSRGNGGAASRRGPAQGATGSAEPGADPPG